MATRRVDSGPTGKAVRENVARIRKGQGLTLRDVAERLEGTERPLAHNTISEIERGARRVDVDDLMALSVALGVNPNVLLVPQANAGDDEVDVTGLLGVLQARDVWSWLEGDWPIPEANRHEAPTEPELRAFLARTRPTWVNSVRVVHHLPAQHSAAEAAEALIPVSRMVGILENALAEVRSKNRGHGVD